MDGNGDGNVHGERQRPRGSRYPGLIFIRRFLSQAHIAAAHTHPHPNHGPPL